MANRKFFALMALLALCCPPVLAEQDGDVVIKRNPDGTIETSDAQDSSGSADGGGGVSGGGGRKPVHSYTKKTSDGIHFKRNPDGSIETWEDEEPIPRAPGGRSKSKKKTVTKTTSKAAVKPTAQKATAKTIVKNSTVKKKTN